MKNTQILKDFALIFLVYAAFAGLMFLIVQTDLLGEIGLVPPPQTEHSTDAYNDLFRDWAEVLLGVSLVLTVFWYALGEWALPGHRTSFLTWRLIWFVLLALTLGASIVAFLWASLHWSEWEGNYSVAMALLLMGAGSWYVATVCFSPVNAKYAPLGARAIRRW